MQSFKLPLPNGATVAGIHNIPPVASSPHYRPLIVGLHGGSYDCHYFDANEEYTAAKQSTALGVPFVAIDRPCYGGTTSFLPVPEDTDFTSETGRWLHEHILPALWTEFGVSNSCNCIVVLAHSLGVMGATFAAALHAQDKTPAYPLGGIIASGLGDQFLSGGEEAPIRKPDVPPYHTLFPLDVKDQMMFRPGTVDPEILACSESLNVPSPLADAESLSSVWAPKWREWASHITAPVKFALMEQDCFFVGTEEHVRSCVGAFVKSSRVDGSFVRGAPHCLELSYWAPGWYASCFGFALECAASFAVRT
ncbi:uncharacterized protein DSM5745_08403 [Aspergillus mulundensis]|uniref:AB hydrolase-1 domain-containing protein n=1 Tax=Aspergillus mulundensis TaxID=1810919 RepID=A0A3D8RA11_9EURO|nr:Uncharacterized protein DSM5745_08403 [Aspergillus mulundensis]RDW70892.1 Uncharacterized protein DSM5745_08403 [Aspergillus mulundensis]